MKEVKPLRIRVRDIAKQVGVSPATVSNALNGKPGVSEKNAKKILEVAKKMGYTSKKVTYGVTKPPVRLVLFKRHGMVVMDTQFFMELIESIERECQSEGLELMITNIHAGQDADYKDRIRAICMEECSGILLLATEMSASDLRLFDHCASPLVAIDNLFSHEAVHAVVMNNYDAGYMATHALYAAGHRHIGHITSTVEFSNIRYRRKGYEAAMAQNKLEVNPTDIWRVRPTLEGAYEDMKRLLEEKRILPTAFFVGNDIMAVGCMRAMQESGTQVPNDVSLIGMDDMSICQIASPQISTMRVYRREMGITAVRMLLNIGRDMSESILKTQISVKLVERQSVNTIMN